MSTDRPEKQRPDRESCAQDPSSDTVELRLGETATLPRPEPTDAPYDAASLLARCWDDRDFARGLVEKFVERSADLLAALDRAAVLQNAGQLVQQAHAVRGIAGNLSAHDLAVAAALLERASRRADPALAAPLVDRVRHEIGRLVNAAPRLIAQLESRQ